MTNDIEQIYTGDPAENMYGCKPCPKCGSPYRHAEDKAVIVCCDDCGYRVQGRSMRHTLAELDKVKAERDRLLELLAAARKVDTFEACTKDNHCVPWCAECVTQIEIDKVLKHDALNEGESND